MKGIACLVTCDKAKQCHLPNVRYILEITVPFYSTNHRYLLD